MKIIGAILLAVPFAVVGERVATDAMAGQYSPPILANGDIGMLIDYRNCQFQNVPSYKTIHAVGRGVTQDAQGPIRVDEACFRTPGQDAQGVSRG